MSMNFDMFNEDVDDLAFEYLNIYEGNAECTISFEDGFGHMNMFPSADEFDGTEALRKQFAVKSPKEHSSTKATFF